MLTTVQFTCSDCAQTIEVNEEMRETILDAGCPVCTAAASAADFDVREDDDPKDGESKRTDPKDGESKRTDRKDGNTESGTDE